MMLAPKAILERSREESFQHVDYLIDGEPVDANDGFKEFSSPKLELAPPLSNVELQDFERSLRMRLPGDIRELLGYARGFSGLDEPVSFVGAEPPKYEFAVTNGLVLTNDGTGNQFVIRIRSDGWGPVWFACHDPPAVILVCHTLAEFIEAYLDQFRLHKLKVGHRSALSSIDSACGAVQRLRYDSLPLADELTLSSDEELASFARELPQSTAVIDLRSARPGAGFRWTGYHWRHPIRHDQTGLIVGIPFRQGLWRRIQMLSTR